MKTNIIAAILTSIVLIAAASVGAYLLLPVLIREKTADIRSDLQKTETRLRKAEAYIVSAEQTAKEGGLKQGADGQAIIAAVNRQGARLDVLEGKTATELKRIDNELAREKQRAEKEMKDRAEKTMKIEAEGKAFMRAAGFDRILANVKTQVLKARLEIAEKNLGNARKELDLIDRQFDRAAEVASPPQRQKIKELHEMLGKVKTDLDVNLAAAANRLNLLWHEVDNIPEQR